MMSAVTNVETVAQVGLVKLTGGVALYLAHVRQMERQTEQARTVAAAPVERLGRG